MKPRTCPNCGDLFTPTSEHRKFCSESCRKQNHKKNRRLPPIPEQKCKVCGNMFQPKTARQGQCYCSDECRSRRYVLHRIKSRPEATTKPTVTKRPETAKATKPQKTVKKLEKREINCKNCNAPFEAKRKNAAFCSRKCGKAFFNKQRATPKSEIPEVKCRVCGTMFKPETARKGRVYCSQKCRSKGYFFKGENKETRAFKPRLCIICGLTFTPKSGSQRICGYPCILERRRLKRKSQREPPKLPVKSEFLEKALSLNVNSVTEPVTKIWETEKPKSRPQPKPEFSLNLYFCYRCQKKVHAKIREGAGYCPVCGDLVFSTGAADLQNYHTYIKSMETKKIG